MGIFASASLAEIRTRGSVKDSDVLRLRRAFEEASAITPEDAEALIALHLCCPVKDPAWADFFVEAIADCVVNQTTPEGYMVPDKVRWVIGRLGQDRRLRSSAEIELFVTFLDSARWSPPSLVAFVLEQVRWAVETGTGPLRGTATGEPGAILAGDVALIRRVLSAFSGDGAIAVTRIECEALLAIDAVVRPGRSTPAWTDLLVRAVGSGVLSGLGRAVPPRDDLLSDSGEAVGLIALGELRARLGIARGGVDPGTFLRDAQPIKPSVGGSASIWASCRQQSAEERAMGRLERQRLEIVTGEPIEEADEAWLVDRLSRQTSFGENELALLAYLQREANGLPKPLQDLVARALLAA
jgi:hypothetical protein